MTRDNIVLRNVFVFIAFIVISAHRSQVLKGQSKYIARKDGHLIPRVLPVSVNCNFVSESNVAINFKRPRHGMYFEFKAQSH